MSNLLYNNQYSKQNKTKQKNKEKQSKTKTQNKKHKSKTKHKTNKNKTIQGLYPEVFLQAQFQCFRKKKTFILYSKIKLNLVVGDTQT